MGQIQYKGKYLRRRLSSNWWHRRPVQGQTRLPSRETTFTGTSLILAHRHPPRTWDWDEFLYFLLQDQGIFHWTYFHYYDVLQKDAQRALSHQNKALCHVYWVFPDISVASEVKKQQETQPVSVRTYCNWEHKRPQSQFQNRTQKEVWNNAGDLCSQIVRNLLQNASSFCKGITETSHYLKYQQIKKKTTVYSGKQTIHHYHYGVSHCS